MSASSVPPRQPRCSVCAKPTDPAFKPFCSARCADVDLARWLNGSYAIAGGNADTDEDGDSLVVPTPFEPGDDDDAH
jgi:uncharacterized protein